MNRYPSWKYFAIVVALAVGFVYTLPNFYPEAPAVQVSSSRASVPLDNALLTTADSALSAAGIRHAGATLDPTGIKLRFADADAQLKAKDVLQSKLGENYIVALNLLSSSPSWLAAIGALPMYLGLDLRGGIHFLLQVETKAAVDKAIDRYASDIRTLLREKKVQYAGVGREGANIAIRLSDGSERTRARNEIGLAFADLSLRETDTAGGELRLIASLRPEADKRIQQLAVTQNTQILRNRVNELGVAEPVIVQQGADRIAVQLPGVQDTARAKDILGRTAALEIRMVNEEPGAQDRALVGQVPYGSDLLPFRSGGSILVRRAVVLTGDHVVDAQPAFDPTSNAPVVNIVLDSAGARIFRDHSRDNIGKRMAVILVEKARTEVIMAPNILAEIGGGRIVIIGQMNTRETSDIALMMRAGALAAPMEIVEERTIGPSLGKENIDKGFNSVAYGFIVMAIFMCVYYRLMGLISTIALTINLLLLVAILSMLQATLTLPGIAAIALTLGMAIDANVLINERIREELRWGATPHAALQAGYERAWGTILDSNVTTLIAGVALLIFGSGPVRGFAVVHCLGIMTSMFSGVFISRGIVNLIYGNRTTLERISIGQVWMPGADPSREVEGDQQSPEALLGDQNAYHGSATAGDEDPADRLQDAAAAAQESPSRERVPAGLPRSGSTMHSDEPIDRKREAREPPAQSRLMKGIGLLLIACATLLAVAALGDLALRAALRLETRWDTFAYHLPFSALRGGLPIPYEMNEAMLLRYQGFPALPHLLQGLFWRLTGSVNATGVVGYLAFIAFLAYCHVALRARFWLVALIALTAPMVVIHAAASYVDLFGNALLAIGLSSCLFLYLYPERASRTILLCGLAGLVGAAWSKYQLVPVVGLGFLLYAVVALRRARQLALSGLQVGLVLLAAATAAALPYLGNLVMYGNPFWPVRMPVLGGSFPYGEDAMASAVAGQRPPPLRDYSFFSLFFHSLFEINHPTHYADRARWIIDQGNAWIAFRMGGFWNIGVAIYLAAMVAMLVAVRRRAGVVASLVAVAILCFVAVLPQSHELRYYLFIPLCWAAAIGMVFPDFRDAMPRAAMAFLVLVMGLFSYMVVENRVHYEVSRIGYADAAKTWGAPPWWAKLKPGPVYCAVDMMPVGMLLTGPTMTEYSIVDRSREDLCPVGSIVLTADGGQHPKGQPRPVPAAAASPQAQGVQEHINRSLAAYSAGRYEDAIAAARQALALAPDSADAWNNVCAAYSSLQRWDKGIEACAIALQLRPDYQLARNNLAWATSKVPGQPVAVPDAGRYLNESLALFSAGSYDDAVYASTKAVAVQPDRVEAWNNLCAAYNGMKKWDEGIAACTRALAIRPDYQLARNNLAWAEKGKIDAAAAVKRP